MALSPVRDRDPKPRPTPPWQVERLAYRFERPAPARRVGCRVHSQVVLLGIFILMILAVLSFWFIQKPAGENGGPASATGLAPSPRADIARTPVPLVATSTRSNSLNATPILGMISPTPTKYRVQPGDTLGGIASKFRVSVQALMDANGLNNSMIHAGDELTIPLATPTPLPTR